ncbi:MAG: hypothetical protein N4A31_03685 [Rickettsiales bacterium]|jgi:hypothetical protein|nr:hypothetical protein [Rickettsiales bacterium]
MSNKKRIIIILIIGCVLFLSTLLFFLFNELDNHNQYIKHRFSEKISSIESLFNSKIANAKHLIYSLGVTIAESPISEFSLGYQDLINNFDSRNNFDEEITIPFGFISFLTKSEIDSLSLTSKNFHTNLYNRNHLEFNQCIKESEKEPYKVKIISPRIGLSLKEQIIPINMAVIDVNNRYVGQICSGLVVKGLLHKINSYFGYSRHINGIRMAINYNKDMSLESLNMSRILRSIILGRDIFISHQLHKYPLVIEIKLKHNFFIQSTLRFILFSLSVLLIFSVIAFIIYKEILCYYEHPLQKIQKKLNVLSGGIENGHNNTIPSRISSCSAEVFTSINKMIDDYQLAFLKGSSSNIQNQEIQKKILNLIYIEQHFLSLHKSKIGEDKLYSFKLSGFIKEEPIIQSVYDFLQQLTNYCADFYYEVSIKLIVASKDRKDFTFKQTALIEVIFSIFTFIIRSGFDIEDENITLRAEFLGIDDFPTFTIEVVMQGCGKTLGYEVGPQFTHTGLLGIYLLAKENKLFFDINKVGDKISFILRPIGNEIDNLYVNI